VANDKFPLPSVFKNVSALPSAEGRVNVTSLVDAGPLSVIPLVPLSESSKNLTEPALVEPLPTVIGAVKTAPSVKGRSVALGVTKTTALPLKLIALSELLLSVTDLLNVVPEEVYVPVPISKFAPSSIV
jgi:hypothetical protein